MDLVLVRQTIYVDGIECLITEMLPEYPPLTKYHGPFARIIALPGASGRTRKETMPVTAERPSCLPMKMEDGCAHGLGHESGRR